VLFLIIKKFGKILFFGKLTLFIFVFFQSKVNSNQTTIANSCHRTDRAKIKSYYEKLFCLIRYHNQTNRICI